jgi:hypothetical protein
MKVNCTGRSQIKTFVIAKRRFCKAWFKAFTSFFAKICVVFKKDEIHENKVYDVHVYNLISNIETVYEFDREKRRDAFLLYSGYCDRNTFVVSISDRILK